MLHFFFYVNRILFQLYRFTCLRTVLQQSIVSYFIKLCILFSNNNGFDVLLWLQFSCKTKLQTGVKTKYTRGSCSNFRKGRFLNIKYFSTTFRWLNIVAWKFFSKYNRFFFIIIIVVLATAYFSMSQILEFVKTKATFCSTFFIVYCCVCKSTKNTIYRQFFPI